MENTERKERIKIVLSDGREFEASRKEMERWLSRHWRHGLLQMPDANTIKTRTFGMASLPFVHPVASGS